MKNYVAEIFKKNKANGEKTAIVDNDGKRSTSYNELYEKSLNIAAYARQKGIKGVVPVYMPRCAETVEVFLGLGLAGAGVAPLADDTPLKRVSMIEEQLGNKAWTWEEYSEAVKSKTEDFTPADFKKDDKAFLIYTSGSSGMPKGVVHTSDTVEKSYKRIGGSKLLDLKEGEQVLQNTSFSFVAIFFNVYAPLYYGCTSHIISEETKADSRLIEKYINEYGINASFLNPNMVKHLGEVPSLRVVGTGTERVSNLGAESYRIINIWGMTETAACAIIYDISEPIKNTPIGKPLDDFCVYILDDEGNPADEGELCISGAITLGYLDRPDLNEKYFEPNPFSKEEGHRVLMHTGDIVKRLEDGNLLYINRKDFMIKINGQRVEPGEAEVAISSIKGISAAAVKGFTEDDGHSYLCAYYTCDEHIEPENIKKEIEKQLPAYMIPAFYEEISFMPLTASGKVDRKALVKPDTSKYRSTYEAPENEEEALICAAFEKVLDIEKAGANDDFIYLGGDSIRAMAVAGISGIDNLQASMVIKGRTPRHIAELVLSKQEKVYFSNEEKNERALLTDSQMGIYLECMEEPESLKYNIPFSLEFERKEGMDSKSIKEAVDSVISIHPALYSKIISENDNVYMKRCDMPSEGICTALEVSEEDFEKQQEGFILPFDLYKSPLCRAKVLVSGTRICLMVDLHHIVSDGRSITVFCEQVCNAIAGKAVEPEKIDAFSVYEATLENDDKAREYFASLLGGVEVDSNLIPDKNSDESSSPAEKIELVVEGIDFEKLQKSGITKSTFFMGAFGYTLAKMTGQKESLFNAAESGRKDAIFDTTVTMMVKTIPVYMNIDEKRGALKQLALLQKQFYKSIENDNISFVELSREYGVTSDIMFVYQSDSLTSSKNDLGEVNINFKPTGGAISKLSAAVFKDGEKFRISLEYRSDLYDRKTIERFGYIYKEALRVFSEDGNLGNINLIGEKDLKLLDSINMTQSPCDFNETIVDIFRKRAAENPEKTAVICEERKYTYREINDITDSLAAYISSLGIGKEKVVSVLVSRNEYMFIASMGIMKAGAIYQPLDPSYPPERLSFMTEDAASMLLIADRGLKPILPDFKGEVLFTGDILKLKGKCDIKAAPCAKDACILLYTSGTTGMPKGCRILHRNLKGIVHAHSKVAEIDEKSIACSYASYGFDAHITDFYPVIANGGTLVIVPDSFRLDLEAVKNYLDDNRVTHIVLTTQLCVQFVKQYKSMKYLKCLLTGGEKLVTVSPPENYRLINAYGPTETTVYSTYFELDGVYDDIPIGMPVSNTKVYVVDSQNRRLPAGVPGELVISGPHVTGGYLNRPDKTEEVFVPNVFEKDVPKGYERAYKTGDIVRFLNDGNLVFVGRRDLQVKIRGFRIELSEVEKVIMDYPGIKSAVLVAKDAPAGGKALFAYITGDEKIDIEVMNEYIRSVKPPYMVPAATMQLDELPLTVNGKVDKRKLPEIKVHFEDVKKPQNEIQKRIFDKISEVVGSDEFGIETDIFLAGLSSIGSISLCSALADEFGIHVQIRNLKKNPTVLKLEQFILKAQGKDIQEEKPYDKDHPVSKTMEGIFIECIGNPESTFYNIPYLVKLGAGIDEEKLKNAVVKAVEAHPYMKAELFTDHDGQVRQHRKVDDKFTAEMIKDIEAESIESIKNEIVKPFNITGGRLFEAALVHADGLYLFLDFHHIIADGTSLFIFLNDIDKAYEGKELKKEEYSGFDVAEDETLARTKEDLEDSKEYYGSLLEGLDRDFLLLPDKLEHIKPSSGKLTVNLKHADLLKIKNFCEKNRVSMNGYFVSAFGFVLARYQGMEYSVFDTIYNGRNDSRTYETFAMLVKTIPAVVKIERKTSLELVSEISAQLIDSMVNDIYSYGEIARDFGVNSDVMFIYQGDSFRKSTLCGENIEEIELALSDNKAPMALQVRLEEGQIVCELEYDSIRFTEELMKSFVSAFDMACKGLADEDELKNITLLSEEDEADIEKYNNTEYEYDDKKTITDLFLENAKKYPDKLCTAYKNRRISYGEADKLTGKTARFLMEKGIGKGDVAAILINRDENMVIAAHGVVRAGAAYLGLDPTYPSDRLEFMIEDSGSKYLIADRTLIDLIPSYNGPVLYTDEIESLDEITDEVDNKLRESMTPEDDAIIIYSSGTTGLPKGSVLQHKAIVCFYHNYTRDEEIDENANVATYASFGFDGGAMDVFSVPMAGGSLFVVPDDIRLDLGSLEQFFVRNEITNGFMTTQVGTMFVSNTKCRSLRHFMVGGEKFIPVSAPEWVKFQNGYGPSETMCYVNKYDVIDTGKLQPIGKVSGNTKEYIVDKAGNRLPFGACGELCISGGQMGRGYLNRPEKTAEVFVENPFSSKLGYERMYRTGDVVRLLPDGNYDFVGRRDGQVKVRGFRIELSEIETKIRKFKDVKKAVVTAFDSPAGGKALAAYIVSDAEIDIDELKSFIAEEKPDYMVPQAIMCIDEIPLTSNGKVDFKKLPKADIRLGKKGALPADETEETICRIFGEVLGLDKVYADDDFFAIGGSSISAIQVTVKCEQAGINIVYKNLFANPTAQKLNGFIKGKRAEDISADDFESSDEHNYKALEYNVVENLKEIRNEGVGNVLLTGATGYLGSHILREFLNSYSGNIYCLVRSKDNIDALSRLEMMTIYYFEEWFEDEMSSRITVVDGDMEEEGIVEKLKELDFDTIINCAANVKHFAAGDELLGSNYTGVENLIDLAREKDAKLIQISTVSVSGESVNGSVPAWYKFKETDLNIGQSLENKYIYTKYLAEQAVIDAVSDKKIRGKVIRLGNLMARTDDSEFQVNAGTNGFLRMYIGFNALGCFPIGMMDVQVEFSPIDAVAKAVLLLSGTPDSFTVFHARNCNTIHYGYLINAIRNKVKPLEIVEDDIFEKALEKALSNEQKVEELGGLLAYKNSSGDNEEVRVNVDCDVTFTTKALYRLGFAWPLVSEEYLDRMIEMLLEKNYFTER